MKSAAVLEPKPARFVPGPRSFGMPKRSVVVTGGESGIGAACAVAFGEAGDRVAIFYHSDEAAAKAVAAQVEQAGGSAIVQQCSVDDEGSGEAAFAAGEREIEIGR